MKNQTFPKINGQLGRTQSEGNINKHQIKGLNIEAQSEIKNSYPVRQLRRAVESCITQVPDYQFNLKKQKEIQKQKKKLETLRLKNKTQNTKLLKIQQEERKVNGEYQKKKKKMEDTLEILAKQAEDFNKRQREMNNQLEEQKTNVVIKQDNRREKEQMAQKRDEDENENRSKQIKDCEEQLAKLQEEYDKLSSQKHQLQQYEDFLNEVMKLQREIRDQNNQNEESDKNVNNIIEKFKEQKDFSDLSEQQQKELEVKTEKIKLDILTIRSDLQIEQLSHTSEMNAKKKQLDEINQQNTELLLRLDSKFADQMGKHLDFGQIFFGIQNLYQVFVEQNQSKNKKYLRFGNQEDEDEGKNLKDATQTLIEKLDCIERQLVFMMEVRSEFNRRCLSQNN